MKVKENYSAMKKTRLIKKLSLMFLLILIVLAVTIIALNANKIRTIMSLTKVDDYPLYSLTYYGGYDYEKPIIKDEIKCSAFLATNDKGEPIFCRNLDYTLSNHPIAALHTAAPGKYASISMSDLYYFGYDEKNLPSRSLIKGWGLLNAPKIPIDGMNEYGVALAMLSVSSVGEDKDSDKPIIDEVACNRLILDNAKNVDEAIGQIKKYNLKFNEGPIHYIIADSSGDSAVVEFIDGKIVVTKKQKSYQVVTNFVIAKDIDAKMGLDRYDLACSELDKAKGQLTEKKAMELLSKVSQGGTLWSIIYNLKTGEVQVAMNKKYNQIRKFKLNMAD
jgi:hypothetical protein